MNNITSIYNKADRRASLRNRLMIFCFFIFTLTAAPGCDYFSYGHVPHRSDHIPGQDTPVGSTTSTTTAASPQFSPVAGTYDVDQSVVITCATSGATIYYTTDGSSPSASSSVYSAPISVAGNGTAMTIQAYAEKSGMNNSPVASALYNIAYPSAAAPTFSPLPGSYTTTQSVSISSTAGATIYYTIDGTTPTTASTVYSVPISVTGSGTSTTIKAFAVKAGLLASAVSTGVYTIDTTPPTLTTVTLVSNNANTILAKVGDQITLSITASEALSTPPVVTIAGVPVSVTTNSATTYSAMRIVASSDTEGPVAINISGYKDLAGNTGFSVTSPTSGSVAIDRTPPTVSITTPAVINNANKASYSVSGTCSENGIIVTVNAGGVTATPTCTTGSYTATAMNASVVGDNAALSVTANQTDAAGNVTTTSTTVLKDTINPTVSIGTAPTINNANKASYSVSGTCSENGIIVTVNAGGVTATPTCTTGSYTATAMNASGLADSAALSVTANQTDAAGNVTTTSTTVLKDTINPTVSIG
ncbi:MAG: chitobiase/beta-hexosaminidase C-terminal domain-containing protein, partial [Spirochaetia bacterium]|nr:chitobiase/beta-hexosaminidase C-terminal domain-containing protein [Spirochaetia bacterium]